MKSYFCRVKGFEIFIPNWDILTITATSVLFFDLDNFGHTKEALFTFDKFEIFRTIQ